MDTKNPATGEADDLRRLLGRLWADREAEARRLSLALHDQLGQSATGLGMAIYLAERKLGPAAAPAAETFADMRSILAELTAGLRRMSADLRPSILDRLGLAPALLALAAETAASGGPRCELAGLLAEAAAASPRTGAADALDADARIGLYRIAREALANAVRHSGADVVRMGLTAGAAGVVLEVSDSGRGFDPAAEAGRGLGLLAMRERARCLGADFELVSRPGAGTAIKVRIEAAGSGGARTDR